MNQSQLSRKYLFTGMVILLLASLLDNMRGPLIPLISEQLSLNYSQSSLFLVLGNVTSIFSVFMLLFILNVISEKTLSALICLIAISTCGFSFFVSDFVTLAIFASGLGLVVAVMGSICSVFVIRGSPPSSQSRSLAILHTMYGLSSFAASGIVAIAMANKINWPWLFCLVIPFLFGLIYFMQFRLPDVAEHPTNHASQRQSLSLSWPQVAVVLIYFTYIGGEVLSSIWLSTYLVETQAFKLADAADYVAGFFLVMTISRILCFLFYREKYEATILRLALILPCIFIVLGHLGFNLAFCFAGLIGPFYPIMMGRASRRFSKNWRSLILWIVVSNQTALCLLNLLFGEIAEVAGVRTAFYLPPICLAVASFIVFGYFRWEAKQPST